MKQNLNCHGSNTSATITNGNGYNPENALDNNDRLSLMLFAKYIIILARSNDVATSFDNCHRTGQIA